MKKIVFLTVLFASSLAFADKYIAASGDSLQQAMSNCMDNESFQTRLGPGKVQGGNIQYSFSGMAYVVICDATDGTVTPVAAATESGADASCKNSGGQVVGLPLMDMFGKGFAVACLRPE